MILATLPFMYCSAPSAVVSIRKAVDATHAGAGHVTLASGATFEVTKPDSDSFVVRLRKSDRITLCYAPPQRFADAGPGARMAIAGNVRTGDYAYELAYPAKASRTHAASHAGSAKAYAMLVPTIFNGIPIVPPAKHIVVVKTRAADRYRVEVDFAPRCNGANVCSAGAFSGYGPAAMADGHVTNPPDGPLASAARAQPGERPIPLADGSTAYYSQTASGASGGGNSSLRFVRNDTLYVITSRPSTPAKLVATANSAIQHGSPSPR